MTYNVLSGTLSLYTTTAFNLSRRRNVDSDGAETIGSAFHSRGPETLKDPLPTVDVFVLKVEGHKMSARITGQIIFMCPSNFLCILQAINTTERGATVHLFCILTDINVSSEVPLECSASQNILMVVDKNWMWI